MTWWETPGASMRGPRGMGGGSPKETGDATESVIALGASGTDAAAEGRYDEARRHQGGRRPAEWANTIPGGPTSAERRALP